MAIAMARHILVKTEQEALNLKKRLETGADFGQLAKKFSTCPSKRQGGSLGEVRPGQLVKPVDTVIFKKALHTVHGPIKSKFGYHLLETVFRD
jgi:peptidyl-prolyl cis-trans isomerase C